MGNYQPIANTLWRNDAAGTGTTITATGNSGTTPIDLRGTCDVALSVTVGTPGGSSPTLLVQLDCQDACGNWITQVVKTTSITAAGTVVVYGGLHAGTGYTVLTGLGRVAWTVGGTGNPTFPGTQISLIGR